MAKRWQDLEFEEERAIARCAKGQKQLEFLWKLLADGRARAPQYGIAKPHGRGKHRMSHFPSFRALIERLEHVGFTLTREQLGEIVVYALRRRNADGTPGIMVRRVSAGASGADASRPLRAGG